MYAHQDIEQKWQNFWKKNNVFKTYNPDLSHAKPHPNPLLKEREQAPKYFVLDMFPYPSGAGLHVGHPEGYTANDIVARYKHARGYNVLHPMGWDAFGLPAENYAIKTGVHPKITTAENIATFKRQIQSLGFSYDWSREIDTTDPKYFQWTQWIFLKLFEAGLAYEQDLPINYCPSCKTGLANEEVLSDFTCERCGTKVEKKKIRQWVLAITKYAERLLADVDDLDWPEGIKDMQRNWIGKSEGCEFEMRKAIQGNPIALILHGWDDTENRTNWHWMESLKIELEEIGYDVIMEQLPGNNAPNIEIQLEFLEKYKERLDKNSLVIGHSMGGFLGMHFVASLNKKIGKLICVAPVFNGLINYVDWSNKATGWDIGANSMKKEYDSEKIKNNVEDWHIFLSKNDSGILFEKAKEHFDDIKVSHTDIDNAGHFCERDGYKHFSQLFDYIKDSIRVYTTRIDTVFGMTYAVIAPDHPQVGDFITSENKEACESYIKTASQQSDQDRTADDKEKTGVFTGSYVINPYNNEAVPLWIADYVLGSYGTGAVMAVPAHDERDFAFAKKFGLEIKPVIAFRDIVLEENFYTENELITHNEEVYHLPISFKKARTSDGLLCKSGEFTGLTSSEARVQLTAYAEKKGFGHKKINYKLRDWLFSRQRYWGEPIPLIHLETSDVEKLPTTPSAQAWVKDRSILMLGEKEFSKIYDGIYGKIVCDYRLPLELPQVEAYEPAGDGQSPLAKVPEFVNVKLAENLHGKRETNTMPQWGGSCWYYLRFMDAQNPQELVSKAAENYWGSVDSYVGGAEHAVLHLLYARFWHKFLYDIGVVSTIEPFHRLRNQGMILAYAYQRANGGLLANDLIEEKEGKFYEISTGEEVKRVVAKMSKSLKNVVNPDDIVKQFGADTLRLYEMYMGDFADTKPWDTTAIVGCSRFLDRVYTLYIDGKEKFAENDEKAMKTLHKAIKKITEDIENYKFNTAIAQMMICINEGLPQDAVKKAQWKESFLKLLHPFAPHLAEECWEKLSPLSQPFPQGRKEQMTIHYATGNPAKIERLQKIVGTDITIEAYSELIDVEETGKTALECALQKLAAYEGKKINTPILTADTSVHFEGQDFDPTRVRRAAIEQAGKKESELSREEIGLLMRDFYQDIARKAGGKIAFHYTDAFAILYPDGSKKTYEYTRPYFLTDTIFGELNPNIPMRSLYISQITEKTAYNTTDEDYALEFAAQKDMALELFGLEKNSIFFADWPSYDEALTIDSEVTIGVQVLGKLRGEIKIAVDETQESVLSKAKANEDVMKWLEGKEIVKEIYVPGKIVNIVVK